MLQFVTALGVGHLILQSSDGRLDTITGAAIIINACIWGVRQMFAEEG